MVDLGVDTKTRAVFLLFGTVEFALASFTNFPCIASHFTFATMQEIGLQIDAGTRTV